MQEYPQQPLRTRLIMENSDSGGCGTDTLILKHMHQKINARNCSLLAVLITESEKKSRKKKQGKLGADF